MSRFMRTSAWTRARGQEHPELRGPDDARCRLVASWLPRESETLTPPNDTKPPEATPMATERDKMVSGGRYDPRDPELEAARIRARGLLSRLNAGTEQGGVERHGLLRDLLGTIGAGSWIEPPFFCDYGTQITLGERVFFNFNCVVLDPAPVHIGDDVLIGPAVQLLTASHPLNAAQRRQGREQGMPVTIEADVRLGGGVIVCPGVPDRARVGSRSGECGHRGSAGRRARRGQSLSGTAAPRSLRHLLARKEIHDEIPAEERMDEDLTGMSHAQLIDEVRKLRRGIRAHRDSSGHGLCWHHPALWGLLPEKGDPVPTVPEWPEFIRGCVRYRQSLDQQAPGAPRSAEPYQS